MGEYYKHTAKEMDQLYDELNKVKLGSGSKAEQVFDDLVGSLGQLEEMRNKTSVLSLERLSKGQWGILVILAAIIIFSVFALRGGVLFSDITTVLLSTILILVLLIIRDLENFKLGGMALMTESGQENMEAMGLLRYYNKREMKEGTIKIPPHVKEYRVGMHDPGESIDIRIVKVGEEK